ncbi:hypothetical protein WJX73_009455 [Symbiochloris irregularis]|uniref:Uncharacterized protein n=1 Tax=Symbiochloris irregularis TaxID=706552 RepID=A0AAW1NMU8_9CHLO
MTARGARQPPPLRWVAAKRDRGAVELPGHISLDHQVQEADLGHPRGRSRANWPLVPGVCYGGRTVRARGW